MERNGTFSWQPLVQSRQTRTFTDSSATLGYGTYFWVQWFLGWWPLCLLECRASIENLELFLILIALKTCRGSKHRSKSITQKLLPSNVASCARATYAECFTVFATSFDEYFCQIQQKLCFFSTLFWKAVFCQRQSVNVQCDQHTKRV